MICPCCEEKATLRNRIKNLEATVRSLTRNDDLDPLMAVRQSFQLSEAQGLVLLTLYYATGFVTSLELDAVLPVNTNVANRTDNEHRTLQVVAQNVKRIRARLGYEAIESRLKLGYRITDATRARINGVLRKS